MAKDDFMGHRGEHTPRQMSRGANQSAKDADELHDLRVQVSAKERQLKDYEKRCESLASKVDSLVKFLEEERALRKEAEAETEAKEKVIQQLRLELERHRSEKQQTNQTEQGLGENLRKLNDEADRLRREKIEGLEKHQQQQYQVIDLESRLRAA